MTHSLAGRAQNDIQAQLLGILRDSGPVSRVQLGDQLSVSRTTVGVKDLTYWNVAERGGHFPMLEVPSTYVRELRRSLGRISV